MSLIVAVLVLIVPLASTQNVYKEHLKQINNSIQNAKISEVCSNQLRAYLEGLENQELWAWQMLDAKTKIPTGLLAGNYFDLGNFDECLGVSTGVVEGKYCLGTIPVSTDTIIETRVLGNDPQYTGLHFATCIPHKCTADDASKIYFWINFDEKYCYSRETMPELDSKAIAAIAILGIFGVLVVLSTIYDVVLFYKKQKGRDFGIAFSLFTNGRKLLNSSTNQDQMLCLNGIKAISMIWIVIGHEYVNGSMGAIANYSKLSEITQAKANMFIIAAPIAVDTFFVVGGVVIVYSFLKASDRGVKFNIFLFYIHRYIRLTPALAVVVLFHATLLKHFGNGPLWNAFDDHLVEPCKKHWWAALLYIQNYVHDEQACVPQSWYLSVDMQLFILSPLVLLPLKSKPKWALVGLFGLALAGVVVPFVIAFQQELNAFMIGDKESVQKYMFSYYEQTYGRFGAYVIGMILGYFIYRVKKDNIKIRMKWFVNLASWIVCLSVMLSCVYAGHDTMLSPYNKWSHSLYIAFNRPAWAVAISGIIFLCVCENGGPVNVFLSAPVFQFLAKISYAIYLVHYEVILMRAYSYKTVMMLEHFYVFFNFWGDFMFSVGLALVLCLMFESPMIVVERILLGGVVDSSSRIPSGIAKGNIFPMGNYDECLEIEEVETKFCPASINLNSILGPIMPSIKRINTEVVGVAQNTTNLNIGLYYCVLKSCTSHDLNRIFNDVVTFDSECFSRDGKSLDALAITAIVIFAIITLITLLSTLYDIYLVYNNTETIYPLAIAFSLYTNGKKLFSLGGTPQMQSLNGIRALSMLWVVLGHVYMAYVFVPLDNYIDVYKWMDSAYSQYISGATVSVDTFFVIGGFLTIYTFQASMDKGTKFNVPLYYFHRYLRLTPALAAMVLAHAAIFTYLGNGPIWSRTDDYLSNACKKYWWSALLYVQNYANPNGTCVPQSWYLSVDMQLFLISPLILVLMRQWPMWGYITMSTASVASIIGSFLLGWYYKLNGQMTGNITGNLTDFMTYYYMPTHTRMVPYLFGIMLGYAVYKMKNGWKVPQINKILVLIAWVLSLALMVVCLYGGHTLQFTEYNRLANSFYISLMRPSWSLAICWIIFACVMGYGGPINALLSSPILQILSRLSYSIYLVHYSFIFMTNFSGRAPLHFSDYNAFHKFWGDFAFTLVLAIIWTLVFESPVIVLEKVLLRGRGESRRGGKSSSVV